MPMNVVVAGEEPCLRSGVAPRGAATRQRGLEVAGILVSIALIAWLLQRIGTAVAQAYAGHGAGRAHWLAVALLAAVVVGYFFADFASGVVHWAFDRFGRPETPFIGPRFVLPFRAHHDFPDEIATHGFVEINGNNCLAATLPLAGVSLLRLDAEHVGELLLAAMITFSAVFALGTNQFHKWAHDPARPAIASWLQRRRLILSPEHHRLHHTPPFESHYCITSGWMNRPLARLRVWSRAERLAERLVGLRVHRDPGQGSPGP